MATGNLLLVKLSSMTVDVSILVKAIYSSELFIGNYQVNYQISANGRVHVFSELNLVKEQKLADIPRMGMPSEFQFISWFGRGQPENYADRKTSSASGLVPVTP